jgi:GalNAc-alpha-(1->4)-GalNAc-alpha-(1->3)-diNAcBac-PP-undecaprenol alpha-1,4-N-acetyl-D-galactosaminyltransferase
MRITLIIASLGAGGSERAMQLVANHWAAAGHDVSLVTLSTTDPDFYSLHPRIKRVALGLLKDSRHVLDMVRNNLTRVRALRRNLTHARPDAVVSFGDTTNIQTLMATVGLRLPVVICEQIDPRQYPIGTAWNVLRRLLYPAAEVLVVVSSAMATSWAGQVVRQEKVRVIPNPVYVTPDRSVRGDGHGGKKTMAAMGRLVHQKGFDNLLHAFRLCSDRHPEWSLHILGEGAERLSLEALRSELRLDDRVRFLGVVKEPAEVLRQADLFVMSSRFEGFPLSLIEAMACGLPVISTDCPTGPSEIIRNGIDGLLVAPGDVTALAHAMDRLMDNPEERRSLAVRAVEVIERFGPDKIMSLWDQVLSNIVRPARPAFGTRMQHSASAQRSAK